MRSRTSTTNLIINALKDTKINPAEMTKHTELGSGTFSTVYQAAFGSMTVAIKEFDIKNEDSKRNFENERSILCKLTGANQNNNFIVKYYGYIEDYIDDIPLNRSLVVEFMENSDLHNYITSVLPFSLGEDVILRLVIDIVCGLDFMHQYRVIHCDIKCENILLDKNMNAKLCDFGFAKDKQTILTWTCLQGTLEYIAPELIADPDPDSPIPYSEKSDIYAFAIVLYKLSNYTDPYPPDLSETSIFDLVAFKERPKISKKCFPFVASLTRKCWDDNPDSRPNTMELLDEIDNRLRIS